MVAGSVWEITKDGGVDAWVGARSVHLGKGTLLLVCVESRGVYQSFTVLAGSTERVVEVHRDDVDPHVP